MYEIYITVSQRVPKITKVSLSKGRTLKFWFGHTRHPANLVPPPPGYFLSNKIRITRGVIAPPFKSGYLHITDYSCYYALNALRLCNILTVVPLLEKILS